MARANVSVRLDAKRSKLDMQRLALDALCHKRL